MKYHIINEVKILAFALIQMESIQRELSKDFRYPNDYICYNMDRTDQKRRAKNCENYCNQDCIIDLQEFGDSGNVKNAY